MKKITFLLIAVFSTYAFSGVNTATAFSIIKPVADKEVPATVNNLKYLQVSEFVNLSVKEYSELTGKKLSFLQKVSFKATKMKMKRDLKKNPDLKITDYVDADGGTFRLDALWLIIGILLGPIGVLIAYVTKQEKYRITSSWIGFGIWLLLGGVFFIF